MVTEATLTLEEILKRALAKEKAAFTFYDRLLKSTNIELIQDLLQDLKNEEYKHIKMIESKIRRLNLE
jgi:rubrerythrin